MSKDSSQLLSIIVRTKNSQGLSDLIVKFKSWLFHLPSVEIVLCASGDLIESDFYAVQNLVFVKVSSSTAKDNRAQALELGVLNSSRPFILIVDDDDDVFASNLARLLSKEAVEKHDLCFFSVQYEVPGSRVAPIIPPRVRSFRLESNTIPICSVIWRKSLWHDAKLDEALLRSVKNEDHALFAFLLSQENLSIRIEMKYKPLTQIALRPNHFRREGFHAKELGFPALPGIRELTISENIRKSSKWRLRSVTNNLVLILSMLSSTHRDIRRTPLVYLTSALKSGNITRALRKWI